MGQKKLIRFAELLTFPNVFQYPANMKGHWHSFFKNTNGITLELACGKGEYTVGLAKLFPSKNFVGVDIKGNRIWVGAKKCIQEHIQNAAFLRTQIDKIQEYFSKGEVEDIWLTFPDPQLRTSKAKKRLTHPRYLRYYQQILAENGSIHLKTDSPTLYRFTKQVIQLYDLKIIIDSDNIYANGDPGPVLGIKTHYEGLNIAKSNRIHYLQFELPENTLPAKDEELQTILRETETDEEEKLKYS